MSVLDLSADASQVCVSHGHSGDRNESPLSPEKGHAWGYVAATGSL